MGGCARSRRSNGGFSLIELAVVLVIVGLLVGGGIAALDATTEQARRSDQQRQLSEVREGLYGFALARGRLPCPDTDWPPDGAENPPSPSPGDPCDADVGTLPWQQLGLGRRNPWGQPLRYHVEPEFAEPPADANGSAFALGDDADLEVEDGEGEWIVRDTPAIVISFAEQGEQVWTGTEFVCPGDGSEPARGFSSDETENCNGNDVYVAAPYRGPEATGGRFDDLLIWIPDPVLKARMVDVGRLP